jgi:putative transposase
MGALNQLPDGVSIRTACDALGLGRASYYRNVSRLSDTVTAGSPPGRGRHCPPPPLKLTPSEHEKVVEHLHSERFVDQPPREIFATLLSEGEYICSVRTMYRILKSLDATSERRSQRAPMTYEAPFVRASAPNEVWVWDITALPARPPHKWLYAYAVLDLYSRYVVAWLISPVQAAVHAERLFAEACATHDVLPDQLCVHSDRGSPMTSGRLADLFSRLGVNSSFNRPHVSNDNPHAEAHFRTLKYQGDFPKRFVSEQHARQWLARFFSWYNEAHKHDSLALFTPANLFRGEVDEIIAVRQAALDRAYTTHPKRFVNGPPIAKRPPEFTEINPSGFISPDEEKPDQLTDSPSSMPIVRAPNNKGRIPNPQLSLLSNF